MTNVITFRRFIPLLGFIGGTHHTPERRSRLEEGAPSVDF